MNREELIEAARLAYVSQWEAENIRIGDTGNHNRSRAGILAALAVFEQAHAPNVTLLGNSDIPSREMSHNEHAPTDDEPVAYGIYGRATGNLKYVQVMGEQEVAEQSEFYDVVPLFRRPVQGPGYSTQNSNDEREALLDALDPSSRRIAWASCTADRVFAAGFRRPVQGEPTSIPCELEPSDAVVLAAMNAYDERSATDNIGDYSPEHVEDMRRAVDAALRAAAEAGGEGR